VHQAKGLEYDVVFLIGLADGQFPGRRSIEAGDVEEERRLFYVAVTRARNELYLSYPKVASRAGPGGMMLTPSRFLRLVTERHDLSSVALAKDDAHSLTLPRRTRRGFTRGTPHQT
jgi:superfamily I DNA/RNA helicase